MEMLCGASLEISLKLLFSFFFTVKRKRDTKRGEKRLVSDYTDNWRRYSSSLSVVIKL